MRNISAVAFALLLTVRACPSATWILRTEAVLPTSLDIACTERALTAAYLPASLQRIGPLVRAGPVDSDEVRIQLATGFTAAPPHFWLGEISVESAPQHARVVAIGAWGNQPHPDSVAVAQEWQERTLHATMEECAGATATLSSAFKRTSSQASYLRAR